MGTEEIKEHLAEYFPGEAFKRRAKVKDSLDYVHRVMQSSARLVVVSAASDDGEEEICEMIGVTSVPSSDQLKDVKRPWRPHGTFQGLIYSKGETDGLGSCWVISQEYLWSRDSIISDGYGLDPLVESFGFSRLMESHYEIDKPDDEVEALLQSMGAKKVDLENIYDSLDDPNNDAADRWVADLVRHGSEWEKLGLNDDHINEDTAKALGKALAAKFIFCIVRDLQDDGDNRYDIHVTPVAYWNKYKRWYDQHTPLEPLLPSGADQISESTFVFDENGVPKYSDSNVLMKDMLDCGFVWTKELQKVCDETEARDNRKPVLPMLRK